MNGISKFIGSSVCAGMLVFVAGQVSANLVLNPGFETAGANSSLAANWTTDTAAGGPVYGIRTNDNPNSGSFNYEVLLASTGAGPVVQFNQSAIPVTASSIYTFSFWSDRLAGSAGDVEQYNIQFFNAGNGFVGQTGYQNFNPGSGAYAQTIVTNVVAPAGAATATIFLHFAGAAAPTLTATIDVDDVSFATVPEPSTVALVGIGLFGAVALGRKRKS
jgi:hypothetical protein